MSNDDKLYSLFTQLFRAYGKSLPIEKLDEARKITGFMTTLLNDNNKEVIVEIVRGVQENIGEAFDEVEATIDDLEARVAQLEREAFEARQNPKFTSGDDDANLVEGTD